MGFFDSRVHWGAMHEAGANNSYLAAATMGMFTIGVLAAYDTYGPMVETVGTQSWTGVTLVVKWMNLVCYDLIFTLRARIANIFVATP